MKKNLKPKILFTDGEGPIVFKDLAFDVTSRINFDYAGQKIPGSDFFAILSLYDDYLAEKGTAGYQAGDTLALVIPHWLNHDITDALIAQEAQNAQLVAGVKEYINTLKESGWQVRIISTAYRPMWDLVGQYLGLAPAQIACTDLVMADIKDKFCSNQFRQVVSSAEQEILPLLPLLPLIQNEIDAGAGVEQVFGRGQTAEPIGMILDRFYWQELPQLGYQPLEVVRVMGGKRKVEAAAAFADELGVGFKDLIYTGDSITDDQMHKVLKESAGLPVAINGNLYALRNARAAAAFTDARDLLPLIASWAEGGFEAVSKFVEQNQAENASGEVHYHLVPSTRKKAFQEILAIHKQFRQKVRGSAAALG